MSTLKIGDRSYPVVENLGFQGGHYAKAVRKPDGSEAVVVSHAARGPWRFWSAEDRLSEEESNDADAD